MEDLADKTKLLVVGGPTASGKTALSVSLARRLGGEILSADSMQIYRGLQVGTAKAAPGEQGGIPHHMLNLRAPWESYSVAEYVEQAGRTIRQITARGRLPILAGGTGLYISSLVRGLQFAPQPQHEELRRRLEAEWENGGRQAMFARLSALDPAAAQKIHPNNKVRLVRALELCEGRQKTFSEQKAEALPPQRPYRDLIFCLYFADREQLYARIDRRVDAMLQQGLLQEAAQVYLHRQAWAAAAQAIGYKEFFGYFEGRRSLQDCIALLKQASRRYAKRQLTWFRNQENVVWLEASSPYVQEQAFEAARIFLQQV